MSDCAAVKTRVLVLGMIEKACVVFVFFVFFRLRVRVTDSGQQ